MSEQGSVLRRGEWDDSPVSEQALSLAESGAVDFEQAPGDADRSAPACIPKQIIYPMRYLRPLLSSSEKADARFRARMQDFLRLPAHIIPLGRARAGIYLLAKYARTDSRNKVIMLPHTIPDVVNMVRFAGCEPVFVDTLPNSTNVDIDHLRSLIDDQTCCVLVTHYHVNQDRLADIVELCRSRKVFIFEDSAIALEGDYSGVRMGGMSDASVFSMSGFKSLNYIWGGAIATMRDDIAEALEQEVRVWPRLTARQYSEHVKVVLKYDLATREPIFSRLTFPTIQRQAEQGNDALALQRKETPRLEGTVLSRPATGALDELTRKLGNIDTLLAHRRSIAAVYDHWLADHRVSPETSDEVRAGSCYVNYPIRVDPAKRDWIFQSLLKRGFHIGQSLYPNVHETEAFRSFAGRSRNISELVRSMLFLPTHPRVKAGYAKALASAVSQAMFRLLPFFYVAV
jgi:perosamine synthetase